MKHVFGTLAAVLFLVLVSPSAVADEYADDIFNPRSGPYVAGSFGHFFDFDFNGNDLFGTTLEDGYDLDEGDAYTGAIGLYFNTNRIEFEISYFESNYEDFGPTGSELTGDISYLTFMGNIYYDVPTGLGALDFYIGGGIGLAILDSQGDFNPDLNFVDSFGTPIGSIDNADVTQHAFCAQAMAGLSYEVVENIHLFGGYRARYFSESSTEGTDNITLIFREHVVQSVEAGIRIDF